MRISVCNYIIFRQNLMYLASNTTFIGILHSQIAHRMAKGKEEAFAQRVIHLRALVHVLNLKIEQGPL